MHHSSNLSIEIHFILFKYLPVISISVSYWWSWLSLIDLSIRLCALIHSRELPILFCRLYCIRRQFVFSVEKIKKKRDSSSHNRFILIRIHFLLRWSFFFFFLPFFLFCFALLLLLLHTKWYLRRNCLWKGCKPHDKVSRQHRDVDASVHFFYSFPNENWCVEDVGGVVTGLITAGSHTTEPHITWAACMVGAVLQVDLLTGV